MPLYEYRCTECSHEVEILKKLSDPAPVDCPACHKPGLQKKLTAAGFQLKGTGWYVTDFRGGSSTASPASPAAGSSPSPAEAKADAPAAAAATVATEAKPAAPPAAAPTAAAG